MARIKHELTIADLVLLKYIKEQPDTPKALLWKSGGKGYWNLALEMLGLVEAGMCGKCSSDHRFASTISTLKFCGLLEQGRKYRATPSADAVLAMLGKDEKLWPLVLPLDEHGVRDWNRAQFFEDK